MVRALFAILPDPNSVLVRTFSIVVHVSDVPGLMLSETMSGTPCNRAAKIDFRRSSSLADHAAAAARLPVRAIAIMFIAVVFPPPRFPAVTKKSWTFAEQLAFERGECQRDHACP